MNCILLNLALIFTFTFGGNVVKFTAYSSNDGSCSGNTQKFIIPFAVPSVCYQLLGQALKLNFTESAPNHVNLYYWSGGDIGTDCEGRTTSFSVQTIGCNRATDKGFPYDIELSLEDDSDVFTQFFSTGDKSCKSKDVTYSYSLKYDHCFMYNVNPIFPKYAKGEKLNSTHLSLIEHDGKHCSTPTGRTWTYGFGECQVKGSNSVVYTLPPTSKLILKTETHID